VRKRFTRLAYKLAQHSEHKYTLGAVIVKGSKILGTGFNKTKTHTKSNNHFHTQHAEMAAIINASPESIKGADIYVYRGTKQKIMAMSKPCKCCENILKLNGIKRVHYTTDNQKWVTERY
jgi:deoxycytidylate deaminase